MKKRTELFSLIFSFFLFFFFLSSFLLPTRDSLGSPFQLLPSRLLLPFLGERKKEKKEREKTKERGGRKSQFLLLHHRQPPPPTLLPPSFFLSHFFLFFLSFIFFLPFSPLKLQRLLTKNDADDQKPSFSPLTVIPRNYFSLFLFFSSLFLSHEGLCVGGQNQPPPTNKNVSFFLLFSSFPLLSLFSFFFPYGSFFFIPSFSSSFFSPLLSQMDSRPNRNGTKNGIKSKIFPTFRIKIAKFYAKKIAKFHILDWFQLIQQLD